MWKARGHLEDLGIGGWIKIDPVEIWHENLDWIILSLMSFCEHGNEPSRCTESIEFLNYLREC